MKRAYVLARWAGARAALSTLPGCFPRLPRRAAARHRCMSSWVVAPEAAPVQPMPQQAVRALLGDEWAQRGHVFVMRDDRRVLWDPVLLPGVGIDPASSAASEGGSVGDGTSVGSEAVAVTAAVAGNKARKLEWLAAVPARDFPSVVVSYGGAQSNTMRALAALAWAKRRELLSTACSGPSDSGSGTGAPPLHAFVHFTPHVPKHLHDHPVGNYAATLALGGAVRPIGNAMVLMLKAWKAPEDDAPGLPEQWETLLELAGLPPNAVPWAPNRAGQASGVAGGGCGESAPPSVLTVQQGGADARASSGVRSLAQEVVAWWERRVGGGAVTCRHTRLVVALPAGTGTTARFLNEHVQTLRPRGDIVVAEVPCVWDGRLKLSAGRNKLSGTSALTTDAPVVLDVPRLDDGDASVSAYRFAQPSASIMRVWRLLDEVAGIRPDMIYAPAAWRGMGQQSDALLDLCTAAPRGGSGGAAESEAGEPCLLYIHTGGAEGNESQAERYRRAGLWSAIDDAKVP